MAATRKVGFFEAVFACWGAGTVLLALLLAFGFEVQFLDASAWAAAVCGAVAGLYLVSTLTYRILNPSSRSKAKRAKASAPAIPPGLVHRLDARAERRIKAHGEDLARRKRKLRKAGDYSGVEADAWKAEQDAYIERTLLGGVRGELKALIIRRSGLVGRWRARIDEAVEAVERSRASVKGFDFRPGMEGFEYEAFCAEILRRHGWALDNVRDSGDQGVDLVARKGKLVVAIQCKRYRGSVGNAAVQEIVAGKATIGAGVRAAVCSNAPYTKAAQELAEANHVLLLHHDDLPRLEELLKGGPRLQAAA